MASDAVAAALSAAVTSGRTSDAITPVLARVEQALLNAPDDPQAWEPLPLEALPFGVPAGIRSCWVFVLRAGARFGAERHPNSHQRTVALFGEAVFELLIDGNWSQRTISAPHHGGTAATTVSIPPSVWHRITVGRVNLVSMSFHTASSDQLVEETPVGEDLSVTKRRLYHA